MKERPILMNAEMVRAVLAGRKTQTRRVVTPQPDLIGGDIIGKFTTDDKRLGRLGKVIRCPYGLVGDRLWVRETGWQPREPSARDLREGADTWPKYSYDADGITEDEAEQYREWGWKRRPSIHMPRWASRITLEITGVRVERVQDISVSGALAEGIARMPTLSLIDERTGFAALWMSLYGDSAWSANPWVWVIEFKRTDGDKTR